MAVAPLSKWGFGIEIEAVVEPWKIRPEWRGKPQEYYERLALALRNRRLKSKADRLDASYQPQHSEHYDKWFITKDGSLRAVGDQVALEAVSPILKTGNKDWEDELKLFWEAMRKVFKVQANFSCGSHIHIAPINRSYTLAELKTISFAILTHEHLLDAFLPPQRRGNQYCRKNSQVSPYLLSLFSSGGGKGSVTFGKAAAWIQSRTSRAQIWDCMQGTTAQGRYVVWNFMNVQGSGTIEFRGGRHLRGPNRTFWWITFAVCFVSLALRQNLLERNPAPKYSTLDLTTDGPSLRQVKKLWSDLKAEADSLKMDGLLPENWQRMREVVGS